MSFGQNPNYWGGSQQNYGPPPQSVSGGQPYQSQGNYPPGPPFQGHPPSHFVQQPPAQYGQPAPFNQQGYAPPPTPPSPGYDSHVTAQGDASHDTHALRTAMKGFGTDEATLIRVLSQPDPLQMALLRNTYHSQLHRDLLKDVTSETSSHLRSTLQALVRGPLAQDVHNVHSALHGLGTQETILNDVLCGRSNADMNAIKTLYQQTYNGSMADAVRDDLSMKTARLFGMITSANRAEESAPIIPQELEKDVHDLHLATDGRVGTDQMTVCSIIAFRSDGQLRAIASQFQTRYAITLTEIIRKEFAGHMQDALLLMLGRASDPAMTDASALEETMKGAGTKEDLLANRVVRVHWNRQHMDQVKRAYQHKYKRDLIGRVKGEVRGDFERVLVACLT